MLVIWYTIMLRLVVQVSRGRQRLQVVHTLVKRDLSSTHRLRAVLQKNAVASVVLLKAEGVSVSLMAYHHQQPVLLQLARGRK